MEAMLRRSPVVKEENRAEYVGGEDAHDTTLERGSARHDGQRSNSSSPRRKDLSTSKQDDLASSAKERSPHSTSLPSSSSPKDLKRTSNQDDQLESTRVQMGAVKQENARLKTRLALILKDYQSLERHLFDIVKEDHDRKPVLLQNPDTHTEIDESELVSLSLGTSSSGHKKAEKTGTGKASKDEDEQVKGILSLGLDCKFDRSCSNPSETQTNASPESSFEETKEEEAGEPWPPSKTLKKIRSDEGDASELNPVKRARVSVRVRCDTPTMTDGCQWRKYGQKIAKGNPCPRAYYRCTVAPACPVRKQVQRCAEDMSILITTYEGTHNHPLPVSATAMASTTSAAASMIMSGSSSSRPASSVAGDYAATSNIATLHGLNIGLSDISRQSQFYTPYASIISSSPSCPTVTLDLTAPSSSSPSTQFSRLSSSFPSTASYSQTNLIFSPSHHSSSTTPTVPWNSGCLSYGATQPYSTKSQIGFSNLGRVAPQELFYNSHMQKAAHPAPLAGSQVSLTDTAIAAATKAITSDPSFQSALAAAITSIVGGNGGSEGLSEALRRNPRWEEQQVPGFPPFTPSSNGNGCASSYLTRSTSSSSNPQQGSSMFLPPSSLALPSSKCTSTSPVETREHIN